MQRLRGKTTKIIFDMMSATASVWVACFLQFGGHVPDQLVMFSQSITFGFFFLGSSLLFGTHKAIWRYVSVEDLIALGQAIITAFFLFGIYQHFFAKEYYSSPSFFTIQLLVLCVMLAGLRILNRMLYESLNSRQVATVARTRISVLLIGAGDEANRFIKMVNARGDAGYDLVGILDDRRNLKGGSLHGVPVLGKTKHLERIMKQLQAAGRTPRRLVFTQHLPGTRNADMMMVKPETLKKMGEEYGISLSRLPDATSLEEGIDRTDKDGRIQLKPIMIEDLLGRSQAHIDMKAIRNLIAGKRVLVTGAGGSIGGELARQIMASNPKALALIDFSEFNLYEIDHDLNAKYPGFDLTSYLCNIRDAETVSRIFSEFKPDMVFHAAALKHVPLVELNPCEGVLTNVIGTRNVAEACLAAKVQAMVQISTDKAVNPANVMGATKRLGEYYAQALDLESEQQGNPVTRFITVRFGNVLGSSGSVVPLFRKQLEAGGPLTVTHPDIKRYFMTIREAVSLVLQASSHAMKERNERGRIFVLDMGEPVRIVDVARQMIRLADLRPDEDIKINFVGLRPGEKLFEELFDDTETRIQTDAASVLAATPQPIALDILRRTVGNLEESCLTGNAEQLVRILKTAVPGYVDESGPDRQSPVKKARAKPAVKAAAKAAAKVTGKVAGKVTGKPAAKPATKLAAGPARKPAKKDNLKA